MTFDLKPMSVELDRERLLSLIPKFQGKNVLVYGDLMLDRYLWGVVDRISPEAPVPVVRVTSEGIRLGGAGNVANNIVSLGGEARLVGLVGDDEKERAVRFDSEESVRFGVESGFWTAPTLA